MYIRRLILKGYKRLMLSNIQSFEWTPQSSMMILLGRNGSGKSSIIEELTPVPSHHSNFIKGGVKEIHLSAHGKSYVLTSTYEHGTGWHSVLIDGIEHNPSGNMKGIKDLVKELFGLDRETQDVISGISRFTAMSTAKRREWLTRLVPIDLTYGFNEYNKIKTLHRDQVGVIKHVTKRMTNENIDLPDDAEMAQHRVTVDRLTNRLNSLFQARKTDLVASFYSNESALHQLLDLVNAGKRLLKQYPVLIGDNTTTSRDGFLLSLQGLEQSVKVHESMVDHLMHELHELQAQEPSQELAISKEDMENLEDNVGGTREHIAMLQRKMAEHSSCFPIAPFDVAGDPGAKLRNMFERWTKLMHQFPDNSEGLYNSQRGRQEHDRFKQLGMHRRRLENEQVAKAQRLAMLRGCKAVVCPSCTHTFQPGVDHKEIAELEAILEDVNTELEAIAKDEKSLEHYLENFNEYSGYVHQFRQLTQDYPEFAPVWDYCAEHRVMFVTPKKFITEAGKWERLMDFWVAIEQLKGVLIMQEHKLMQARAYDQDAVGFMRHKRKQLEATIEERTHLNVEAKRQWREYAQSGRKVQEYETQARALIADFEAFYSKVNNQIQYLNQSGLDAEIKAAQLQMADARAQLSKMELREHTLKELEREREDAVQLQHDLGICTKAMSPTEGLLGRYLMGFMQVMVGLMNAVIEEIWQHPLEIMPSKVDKDELDYYFPLNVNNGKVVAPDISRGSSGQQGIVNFAFQLLSMKFLKLDAYPLHLDEFGATFDEQHKFNLVPFLLQLIELNQVQQIFYISHYTSTHNAFNQAEFVVVDPANITVPKVYNQNVVMG